jgi:hypothetical protein
LFGFENRAEKRKCTNGRTSAQKPFLRLLLVISRQNTQFGQIPSLKRPQYFLALGSSKVKTQTKIKKIFLSFEKNSLIPVLLNIFLSALGIKTAKTAQTAKSNKIDTKQGRRQGGDMAPAEKNWPLLFGKNSNTAVM